MTAFRDLVEIQAFSFTPLTHKDECLCARLKVTKTESTISDTLGSPIVLVALKIQNSISNRRPKEIHCYLKNVKLILYLVFKMTKQHFDFKLRELKLNIPQNKNGTGTIDFCKLLTRTTRLQYFMDVLKKFPVMFARTPVHDLIQNKVTWLSSEKTLWRWNHWLFLTNIMTFSYLASKRETTVWDLDKPGTPGYF